jgi:predicted nuclease of predicted toxin-antitoxin system
MKFLIDNQLPLALCGFLLGKGHDAVHVLDLGMASATDIDIGRFASMDGRAIITKDADFSVLATMGRCSAPVIWVRLHNCRTVVLLNVFSRSLNTILEKLQAGESVIQIYEE